MQYTAHTYVIICECTEICIYIWCRSFSAEAVGFGWQVPTLQCIDERSQTSFEGLFLPRGFIHILYSLHQSIVHKHHPIVHLQLVNSSSPPKAWYFSWQPGRGVEMVCQWVGLWVWEQAIWKQVGGQVYLGGRDLKLPEGPFHHISDRYDSWRLQRPLRDRIFVRHKTFEHMIMWNHFPWTIQVPYEWSHLKNLEGLNNFHVWAIV